MGTGGVFGGTALVAGAAAALALALPATAADLRKCVAPNGKVSYIDGPCPAGAKAATMRAPSGASTTVSQAKAGPWVRYYEIEGIDQGALLAAMSRLGPRGFHAHATWNVSYEYKTEMRENRCAVASIATSTKLDVIMPRWAKRQGASADLVARWNRYEAALLEHEEGHLEIGREAARTLEVELPRVRGQATCLALEAAVRAHYETVMRAFIGRDKEYDARTGHGQAQGAVFQ